MPMNIGGINDGLQCVADVMVHQLNGPQLLVHPLLIPSMSELEYQYEHAREYSQQEFVKQRGFGMQSAR